MMIMMVVAVSLFTIYIYVRKRVVCLCWLYIYIHMMWPLSFFVLSFCDDRCSNNSSWLESPHPHRNPLCLASPCAMIPWYRRNILPAHNPVRLDPPPPTTTTMTSTSTSTVKRAENRTKWNAGKAQRFWSWADRSHWRLQDTPWHRVLTLTSLPASMVAIRTKRATNNDNNNNKHFVLIAISIWSSSPRSLPFPITSTHMFCP